MTDQLTTRASVRNTDILRERLNDLHLNRKTSWRKIAAQDEFQPVPAGTLCAIAKGAEVPKRWKTHLGLPDTTYVVVIGAENIPPGAQVISASLCECGQWFISNHPARKRCFLCSPFRKRIK